jgi:hypothetical protein
MEIRSLRAAIAASLVLAAAAAPTPAQANPMDGDAKRSCVYPAHSVGTLGEFDRLVGRDVDCVMVFNDAAPDWTGWEKPWFVTHGDANYNWAKWKAAVPGRQLIITQNLFPSTEKGADWLSMGASGVYTDHARALAQNLVAAGLGDSVIRLAHEANGDWYPYSLPNTAEGNAKWVQFWRQTVLAMKSVPGADFRFDWCVNAAYRPIALDSWYPGDDVVDIVGDDAYDSGIPLRIVDRWWTVWTRPLGLQAMRDFAVAHGKPLSIPEWGVAPVTHAMAGGDDERYVDGIGRTVRYNAVAYQAYFYKYEWADQLRNGPLSLAAYKRHFGAQGDAVR